MLQFILMILQSFTSFIGWRVGVDCVIDCLGCFGCLWTLKVGGSIPADRCLFYQYSDLQQNHSLFTQNKM